MMMPRVRAWLKQLMSRGEAKCHFEFGLDFVVALWDSQQGLCAFTFVEMGHTSNDPCAVSIDRIDSAVGYVPGNVQLVCEWVGRARGNMSNGEFRRVLLGMFQTKRLEAMVWSGKSDGVAHALFEELYEWTIDMFWGQKFIIALTHDELSISTSWQTVAIDGGDEGMVCVSNYDPQGGMVGVSEVPFSVELADPGMWEKLTGHLTGRVGRLMS